MMEKLVIVNKQIVGVGILSDNEVEVNTYNSESIQNGVPKAPIELRQSGSCETLHPTIAGGRANRQDIAHRIAIQPRLNY